MKIRCCTKRTWTILKSLMTKLTRIKITKIKMVILCWSTTIWTRNILLIWLAMNTFVSLTKFKWMVVIVGSKTCTAVCVNDRFFAHLALISWLALKNCVVLVYYALISALTYDLFVLVLTDLAVYSQPHKIGILFFIK